MADKFKGLLNKVLEWWNKFTSKQKTIIIAATAGVILMIAIVATVLTRPQYVVLANCETTKEGAEVSQLLEDNSIKHEVSDDGLQIKVLKESLSDANLLLGANGIQSEDYSIDNVVDGSLSTTEADKMKKYQLYMETKLKNNIERMDTVKTATVDLSLPENDGTLLSAEEESFASIMLELEGEFTSDHAATLARSIATAIGNTTTNNIVIMDVNGNMLFSGDDNYTVSGVANSQLTVKTQAENLVKNEVKRVLLGTNEFDNIEVASNLALDFSTTDRTDHTYYAPEGQTQGVLAHEDIYNAENVNSNGGVPGTTSNADETTYQFQDNANSSSTQTEESRDYLPNETVIQKTIPAGLIVYADSSVSVTAIDYNVIREEEAEEQGLLDGITWEEYKVANSQATRLEVHEDLYSVVAHATGIDVEDITIVAYRENVFFDAEGLSVTAMDVMSVILIIVILAFLAFVIFRSMRGEKEAAQNEELPVESIIHSVAAAHLEDISAEEQSETKKLIDKFVDENPEAAASLLRNWLNEDWG